MIIQFCLSMLLGGVALLVASQRTTSRLVRALILAVVAVGGVFVWVPDQTTAIARMLGVGRGADLLLYLWVLITMALILILYLKLIRMGRRITQLTRTIALTQAREPQSHYRGR